MRSVLSIFRESSNSFEGQENGEVVAVFVRRHPFTILVPLLSFIVLAIVPIIVFPVFLPFFAIHGFVGLVLFLWSLWYLFIWAAVFYSLTMYSLNFWIITDRRVISSTQKGFFNRTVSELHMNRIQDITVHTSGAIQSALRFGDLQIQTAGTEEKFIFTRIPNPIAVKDRIMELASKHQGI